MEKFDWDEYFERKQNLLFSIWVEDYERKVEKARYKELAIRHHAIPYLASQIKTNPFDGLSWSSDPDQQRFNQFESDFFTSLYSNFKGVWFLNAHNPVNEFIEEHLRELVRAYLTVLFGEANDWEMVSLSTDLADAFVENRRLLRRSVLRWIIERFALERMTHYLSQTYNISLEAFDNLEGYTLVNVAEHHSYTSVDFKTPIHLFVENHPKSVAMVIPKKGKKRLPPEHNEKIATIVDQFIAQGLNHKAAIAETMKTIDRGERTVYRALRNHKL